MIDLNTIQKLDTSLGHFRFKKFGPDTYLITNDIGRFHFLSEDDFKHFITGSLDTGSQIYSDLKEKFFIKDPEQEYISKNIELFSERNSFLKFGPSLHIVIPTLRCNHSCIYCHASAGTEQAEGLDMDMKTAKNVVDTIMKTPNKSISIEFQGGEPLLNWEVVKFIINYATEKNKIEKKQLLITIVSNLTVLDQEKLQFLVDHNVAFCTSLDGGEQLHNFNRVYAHGNSFQEVTSWIQKINEAYREKYDTQTKRNYFRVGALTTITRKTLEGENYKELVDTYIDLGLKSVHIRYLNPYGFALNAKEKIWYSPQEFIDFYRKAFDYILEKNYSGTLFAERGATIYLTKMLHDRDPNYLDLRSPCGAAIGQIAYHYNGDAYTCDEGRMLARMQDDMFKLGNVNENNFEELINNDTTKSVCFASCTDALPGYDDHVYKPYMGVCPAFNYQVYGNVFQPMTANDKFKMDEAIIDYLFEKIQNKKNHDIFLEWIDKVGEMGTIDKYILEKRLCSG